LVCKIFDFLPIEGDHGALSFQHKPFLQNWGPVKSKENVTEQGWLVQMKMLPKYPSPFAVFQIYSQELFA